MSDMPEVGPEAAPIPEGADPSAVPPDEGLGLGEYGGDPMEGEVPVARVVFLLDPEHMEDTIEEGTREEARDRLMSFLEDYLESTKSTDMPIYMMEDDDDWLEARNAENPDLIAPDQEMPHLPEGPDDMVAPPMDAGPPPEEL